MVLAGLLSVALWLGACQRQGPNAPLTLNDFEGPEDLDQIAWRCRTTFRLSKEYRSHGQSGLEMTLYPDDYPGLRLLLSPQMRQWQGYGSLALDVFNPQGRELALHYRIDDSANPDYEDRANGSFRLQPGANHLRLDLGEIRTSGSKRPLHLNRIWALMFFQTSPTEPTVLGVDYIRLE